MEYTDIDHILEFFSKGEAHNDMTSSQIGFSKCLKMAYQKVCNDLGLSNIVCKKMREMGSFSEGSLLGGVLTETTFAVLKTKFVRLGINSNDVFCISCHNYGGKSDWACSAKLSDLSGISVASIVKIVSSRCRAHQITIGHKNAMKAQEKRSLARLIIVSYGLALNNAPLTSFAESLEQYKEEGVDVGKYSISTALNLIDVMSETFRSNVANWIRSSRTKFTIILNEYTNALVIHFRLVPGARRKPVTIFFDLVQIQETDTIETELLNALNRSGIDQSVLKDNLICVCTDGGSTTSKVGLFMKSYIREIGGLDILVQHCLNDRTQLILKNLVLESTVCRNIISVCESCDQVLNDHKKLLRKLRPYPVTFGFCIPGMA